MKKLLLMLFLAIIATTTIQAQVELKGIKINDVNQFEGTKSLAGIDFNLKTRNLSNGNCVAIVGHVKDEKLLTPDQLTNLVKALSQYYNFKMNFWYTSDDQMQGFYRAALGKGKDKVVVKVETIRSPETMPNYKTILFLYHKTLYSEYQDDKEVEL